MSSIAPHIEAFLREHLARHRGASQHTCDSYAYSFQSLFEFASHKLKVAPAALTLEQLDATLISTYLQHLEADRGNSAQTRNVRLAAIRSFFRFLQHREPAALDQVRRVLAIPFKITDTRLVTHFDTAEVQALLDAPDPATREGTRDRAMLHLAICAGLRVSELTGLCMADVAAQSTSIACLVRVVEKEHCRYGNQPPLHCALGWRYEAQSPRPKCSSTLVVNPSADGALRTYFGAMPAPQVNDVRPCPASRPHHMYLDIPAQ